MSRKMSVISGVAACALLGASVGCFVNMMRSKKPPIYKTAGSALKSVGSMIEHMHF